MWPALPFQPAIHATGAHPCRPARTPSPHLIRWTCAGRVSPRGSPPASSSWRSASAVSAVAAAAILGVQAIVFAIGAQRGPQRHPYGLIFRSLVAPRFDRSPRRNRYPAEVRPTRRFGVRGGRCRRVRRRCPTARPDRHGLRARGGVSQRGLRHLPRLSDLSARRTFPPRPRLTLQIASNRKDFLHGTLRRPGHDRLGREQSRSA